MIQFYDKHKNKSVMIWACFKDDDQKSDLVFMSDDSEAKQEEVILVIYLKILEEQMSMLWESDLIYMQNEASIHITIEYSRVHLYGWFSSLLPSP